MSLLNLSPRYPSARLLRLAGGACAGLTLLASCGPASESDSYPAFGTGCAAVSSDQKQSFMIPVAGFPQALILDSSFSAEERATIGRAVTTWNRWGREVSGQSFFEVSVAEIPAAVRRADPRDCDQPAGGRDFFYVTRVSSPLPQTTLWRQMGFDPSIPAGTIRCTQPERRVLLHQMVLINADIAQPSQLESVALHELGHVLGLDHSCERTGSGTGQYRACAELPADHPYVSAVMFPMLRLGNALDGDDGQRKESLSQNDRDRMNCLYGPSGRSSSSL